MSMHLIKTNKQFNESTNQQSSYSNIHPILPLFNRVRFYSPGGVVGVLAGAGVEFPAVPGTGDVAVFDISFSERPAFMRTGDVERADHAILSPDSYRFSRTKRQR